MTLAFPPAAPEAILLADSISDPSSLSKAWAMDTGLATTVGSTVK